MARRPETFRKEVSFIKRAEMYDMHKAGAIYAAISREYLFWTVETVKNVCKQIEERENHEFKSRSCLRKTDAVTDRILMLDHVKTHKIKEIRNWCREHEYELMKWPSYSPDLNLIEMIWKKIKNMIYKAHPELRISSLGAHSLKEEIEKAVFEAWLALDPDWCENLMESMPRRVEAVLKANGGYIKH